MDTLPYAPLPDATKPVADLTLDEIALEDLAYIRIRQTKETRTEIEAHKVVAVYYNNALDLDLEMPAVPSAGVGLGVGKFGPHGTSTCTSHVLKPLRLPTQP